MERRLSAILAADMVGYSRLIEVDEVGTLERQKTHRQELIDPALKRFGGRIFKEMGDGILVEFPSVVDAVNCAVEVQRSMSTKEADVPGDKRIYYRVGINLGDVVVEQDDLYGDGVNIAARLEQLAEPGGICISGTAYDTIRSNTEVGFQSLGEVGVKNIKRPIRAYNILLDPKQAGVLVPAPADKKISKTIGLSLTAVVIAMFVGISSIWLTAGKNSDLVLEEPSGLRVAVLPFKGINQGKEQEYFADGLTEDIITRLSRFNGLGVIARNSVFRYKDKSVDVRTIGNELSAQFVLEGSVRSSTDTIRVTAQLTKTSDGTHVWAEIYDRPLTPENVFAIQDDVTERIVAAAGSHGGGIQAAVLDEARRKPPQDIQGYSCVILSNRFVNTIDPTLLPDVMGCLARTVKEDPEYADAWAAMSYIFSLDFGYGFGLQEDPLKQAIGMAIKAVELEPNNENAQKSLAFAQFFSQNKKEALIAIEKALRANPNDANLLANMGFLLAHLSEFDRGKELTEKALKLDPFAPHWYQYVLFHWYNHNDDYNGALSAMEAMGSTNDFWQHGMLANALVTVGRLEEAEQEIELALKINPKLAQTIAHFGNVWWWDWPKLGKQYTGAFQKLGLKYP